MKKLIAVLIASAFSMGAFAADTAAPAAPVAAKEMKKEVSKKHHAAKKHHAHAKKAKVAKPAA